MPRETPRARREVAGGRDPVAPGKTAVEDGSPDLRVDLGGEVAGAAETDVELHASSLDWPKQPDKKWRFQSVHSDRILEA